MAETTDTAPIPIPIPTPSPIPSRIPSPSPSPTPTPFSVGARLILIIIASALLWLSLPPIGAAPLALVAMLPFLLALRGLGPRAAAWTGFGYGFISSAACAHWFVHVFPHWYMAVPLWTLLAIFPTIYALGHAAAARRSALALAVIAPALFVSLDWLRGEGTYLRFAWFDLGHALAGDRFLRQEADLAGVYGLTLLAFGVSFLIERAIAFKGDGRAIVLAFFPFAIVAAFYARGNRVLNFAPAVGEECSCNGLRVVAVQDETWDRVDAKAKLTRDALAAEKEKPDVVLWPEDTIFHDWTARADEKATLQEIARNTGSAFIFGVERPTGEPHRRWNAAVILGKDGAPIGEYHKRNPVQFIENVVAGDEATVVAVGKTRAGILTCYDGTYPFVARDLVAHGAEVILTPSMDVAEWGPVQHAMHALFYPLRACEVRRPIVRAASSGVTFAIDAWGREVGRVDGTGAATLAATVHPKNFSTLYSRGGWMLPFFSMAIVALGALAAAMRRI